MNKVNEIKKILLFTDEAGLSAAVNQAKKLKKQSNCLIYQINPANPLHFQPVPSKILLTHFPAHVIAAIPLLEDYKVASRLCGIDRPGFWEGSLVNLLDEVGNSLFSYYDMVMIFGTANFISVCSSYLQKNAIEWQGFEFP